MRKLLTALVFLAASFSQCGFAQTATTTSLTVTSAGSAVTAVAAATVVTLTATVQGGAAVTTGQVNFCDAASYCADIHLLGTAQLTSAGTAALNFIPSQGSHSYKAVFLGTGGYGKSVSGVSSLTVTGTLGPSATTIAQSGAQGDITLTATVSGPGLFAPTGTVSFLDTSNANAVLASESLVPGQTTVSWLNPQTPATGTQPQAVAAGDLNGDGIADLAVLNLG